MPVPYPNFASATTSIPLSQLDNNFATTITLGNVAIQLGNVVTSLGNVTLTNTTVTVGNVTTDLTVHGLTVGQGGGSVSTNTAVGASALAGNSTGGTNTAVGYQAGLVSTVSNQTFVGYSAGAATTTGTANTALGSISLISNTIGANNVALGAAALYSNTTASNNTAVGYQAGYTNSLGGNNTFIGYLAGYTSNYNGTAANTCIGVAAGYSLTTGVGNCFIGGGSGGNSGYAVTTGSKNTIIGSYTGNQGGLNITTSSNYIVLSDGDGNPRGVFDNNGNLLVGTTSTINGGLLSVGGRITAKTTTSASETLDLWNSDTTGNNNFAQFSTEGTITPRGSITYNRAGGLTVYNTTSDYRAKDIFGAIADSGSVIDSVPVYMGKMHGATQERPMFLAHETPEYAHTGEKDAVDKDGKPVYQQMDASALIPVMWAEIQSLRKRLAAAGI